MEKGSKPQIAECKSSTFFGNQSVERRKRLQNRGKGILLLPPFLLCQKKVEIVRQRGNTSTNCHTNLATNAPRSHSPVRATALTGDVHCNSRGCITLEQSVASAPYLYRKWQILVRSRGAKLLTERSAPRLVRRYNQRTAKWTFSLRFNTRTLYQKRRELLYRKGAPPGDACTCNRVYKCFLSISINFIDNTLIIHCIINAVDR